MTRPEEEFAMQDEHLAPGLGDVEASTADAVEQWLPVAAAEPHPRPGTAFEADEYDALEQAHVVSDPDDEYR